MERTLWTDERVTDAVTRIDQRFEAVEHRFDSVDRRLDGIHDELREIRASIGTFQRQFAQIGWGLAAALFLQTIAFVVTTSLR